MSEQRDRPLPRERPGAPGGRRSINRERRLEAFQGAALQLFLAEGIEPVSIDRLVRAAGTSKGNFYRYFRDKEQLVEWIFQPLSSAFFAALDQAERAIGEASSDAELLAAYQMLGMSAAQVLLGNRDQVLLYLQECRGPATAARQPVRTLAEGVSRRSVELSLLARERGLLRSFDSKVSALAVIGAIERLLFAQLSGDDLGDPQDVAAALISLVMDGLRPGDEP